MSAKPKVIVDLTEGRCTCGCGEETKAKSRFRPGHDQRLKGQLKRAHLAAALVQVREGTQRASVSAREAAQRLDTDRYSWSDALTPTPDAGTSPVASESTEKGQS